jgi:hypothetical protein
MRAGSRAPIAAKGCVRADATVVAADAAIGGGARRGKRLRRARPVLVGRSSTWCGRIVGRAAWAFHAEPLP